MIRKFNDERDIFFERRLGMFIHWGLYSIPAWHEQILWRGSISRSEYEKLIDKFNPVDFNPDDWLDLAEKAGMQYIIFTTKHHDGFCMWDTKYTDYNVMNTPYGKDILGMLAEACRKRNFPLSLYYSCPDWHHPNYPNKGRHHEMFGPRAGEDPDIDKYYEFVRNQVRELCTRYGKIYQFFWDVNVAEHYDPSLNDMIRSLQPGILINDRGPSPGDYSTPERHIPEGKEFKTPTEAVQSLGRESWGYRADEDYYSDKYILQSVDKCLAMGGNYVLNAGPDANGRIPPENERTLEKLGKWLSITKEAFYGAEPASYMVKADVLKATFIDIERDDFLVTRKWNTIYVHLYRDIQSSGIILKPLGILPEKVTLLNDGRELDYAVEVTPWHWMEKPWLRIKNIPVNEMTDTVMIIKIEFKM